MTKENNDNVMFAIPQREQCRPCLILNVENEIAKVMLRNGKILHLPMHQLKPCKFETIKAVVRRDTAKFLK